MPYSKSVTEMIKKGVTWLKEFIVNMRAVRWDTIEEGDANAHEEGDDDEAETSAEGVNESEPVNSSLYRQTAWEIWLFLIIWSMQTRQTPHWK